LENTNKEKHARTFVFSVTFRVVIEYIAWF